MRDNKKKFIKKQFFSCMSAGFEYNCWLIVEVLSGDGEKRKGAILFGTGCPHSLDKAKLVRILCGLEY